MDLPKWRSIRESNSCCKRDRLAYLPQYEQTKNGARCRTRTYMIHRVKVSLDLSDQPCINWCPKRDSNPHCVVSKTIVSFQLDYLGIKMAEHDRIERLSISRYYDFQDRLRSQPQHTPIKMARSEGFEPPTFGVEIRNSIQLSYERINWCFLMVTLQRL